jgi:hypothetical protein
VPVVILVVNLVVVLVLAMDVLIYSCYLCNAVDEPDVSENRTHHISQESEPYMIIHLAMLIASNLRLLIDFASGLMVVLLVVFRSSYRE